MSTMPVDNSNEVNEETMPSRPSLLVVVGEPASEEHKQLILEQVSKGFSSWNDELAGCDISEALSLLANQAPVGEEGPNGEHVVSHTSDLLDAKILINPQLSTLKNSFKELLSSDSRYKHVIYAGHVLGGSGSWLLQDDWFTSPCLINIFKEAEVEEALKQHPEVVTVSVNCTPCTWKQENFEKADLKKTANVLINPTGSSEELTGAIQFSAYISFFVKVVNITDRLKGSDVIGNIRFSKPTLYIFPGSQGDSSLFGVSGFNLLVNGGFGRNSCFWPFTRHLDRIDAMLVSHLGSDNILGLSSVFERKVADQVHPEIGFVYMNTPDKGKHSPNGDSSPEGGGLHKPASLVVSIVEEANKIVSNMNKVNCQPHPCARGASEINLINLYHKIGHGSLDMYLLNPVKDSKDLDDFYNQWNKHVDHFTKAGKTSGIPLPDTLSMCALLVWRPSSQTENITRILFPGNTPQNKIFEGLDKLKSLDVLKLPQCNFQQLHAPKAPVKKVTMDAGSKSARAPSAKAAQKDTKVTKVLEKTKPKTTTKSAAPKKEKKSTVPSSVLFPPASPIKEPTPSLPKPSEPEPVLVDSAKEKSPPVIEESSTVIPDKVEESLAPESEQPVAPVSPTPELPDEVKQIDADNYSEPDLTKDPSSGPEDEEDVLVTQVPEDNLVGLTSQEKNFPDENVAIENEIVNGNEVEDLICIDEAPKTESALIDHSLVEPVEAWPSKDAPSFQHDDLGSPEPLPDPNQFDESGFKIQNEDNTNIIPSEAIKETEITEKWATEEREVDDLPHVDRSQSSTPPTEVVNDIEEHKENDLGLYDLKPSDEVYEQPDLFGPPGNKDQPDLLNSTNKEELLTDLPDNIHEGTLEISKDEDFDTETAPVQQGLDETLVPEGLPFPEDPDETLFETKEKTDFETTEEAYKSIENEYAVESRLSEEQVDSEDTGEVESVLSNENVEEMEDVRELADDTGLNKADHGEQLDDSLGIEDNETVGSLENGKGTEEVGESGDAIETEAFIENSDNVEVLRREDDLLDSEYTEDNYRTEISHESVEIAEEVTGLMDDTEINPSENERQEEDELREDDLLGNENIEETEDDLLGSEDIEEVKTVLSNEDVQVTEGSSETSKQGEDVDVKSEIDENLAEEPETVVQPDSKFESENLTDMSVEKTYSSPLLEEQEVEATEIESEDKLVPEEVNGIDDYIENDPSDDEQKLEETEAVHYEEMQKEMLEDEDVKVESKQEKETTSAISPDEAIYDGPYSVESPLESPKSQQDLQDTTYHGEDTDNLVSVDEQNTPNEYSPSEPINGDIIEHVNGDLEQDEDNTLKNTVDDLLSNQISSEKLTSYEGTSVDDPISMKSENAFELPDGWDKPMSQPPPEEVDDNCEQAGIEVVIENGQQTTDLLVDIPEQKQFDNNVDPLEAWGQPMGLPSPTLPETNLSKDTEAKGSKKSASTKPTKKTTTTSKSKTTTSSSKTIPTSNGTPGKRPLSATSKSSKPKSETPTKSNIATKKDATDGSKTSKIASTKKVPETKKRPATAPLKSEVTPKKTVAPSTKRPTTATSSRGGSSAKSSGPLPPPCFVDLTYVPHHSDSQYADTDFFHRVRARFYVFSSLHPNPQTLNALMDAKEQWEDKGADVTIIPTYDTDTLRHWMGLNRDRLGQLKIDIAPAANRCTIQLQDHETSCSAYRLEF